MISRPQSGFTAVEVLVVIAIIAVLAAMAGPAMQKLLATQSVRSTAYDLVADFSYARSQAIALSNNVTVSSTGGTDWKQGWTIVSGANNLRTQGSKSGQFSVAGTGTAVTFNRTGRLTTNATLAISIAPYDSTATSDMKRCVSFDPSGRVRSVSGACS